MSRQPCLLIPALLALTGCSGLLHSTAPAVQLYTFGALEVVDPVEVERPPPGSVPAYVAPTLRIDRPQAGPGLNTDRIALMRSGNRLDYYAGSRWSAPLAELVADEERTAFRNDVLWSAVADDRSSFNTDYLLQTSIDRFTAEYAGESAPPTIRVDLHGLLIRRADGSLVGSFAVSTSQVAKENRMVSVVEAFSTAESLAIRGVQARSDALLRSAKSPAAP
jgi:ABC-type uncharacterized transport system auxiliary subunit